MSEPYRLDAVFVPTLWASLEHFREDHILKVRRDIETMDELPGGNRTGAQEAWDEFYSMLRLAQARLTWSRYDKMFRIEFAKQPQRNYQVELVSRNRLDVIASLRAGLLTALAA